MRDRLSRRGFLAGAGALVVSFRLGGLPVRAQPLSGSLQRTPALDSWLRVDRAGKVVIFTGKAELGQGVKTALAQIAADELDVALERIELVTADTERTPNEGYTAGSMSIEQSGAAIRAAAAETRHLLLELAAGRLGLPVAQLRVEDGVVHGGGSDKGVSYWVLVDGLSLQRRATGSVPPKAPEEYRYVGRPVPRLDMPGKVFGAPAFVHDLRLPDMLHGRVVRPPGYGAVLDSVDERAARALPGVVAVVRDGYFLGVVAEREEQAMAASSRLRSDSRWRQAGGLPDQQRLDDYLRRADCATAVVHEQGEATASTQRMLESSYHKPYIAHASIAPSCAVALWQGESATVWTHSQGVFPLRSALATVLGIEQDRLRVVHQEGAGCFGHNGADDVACDAALLARAVAQRPVRVQWSRQDEFRWEPYGSAMSFRLRGGVDGNGRIAMWEHEIWSHPHSTRPGRQPTLLAGWSLAKPVDPPRPFNIPLPSGGADRNAVPLYDFPNRVVEHFIPEMPIRVSALRALGGYGNHFALESFIDELAVLAGVDPLDFRLRHLSDERARAVLQTAAQKAGWGSVRDTRSATDRRARGRGLGFGRYKNHATYFAVVAEVAVERDSGQVHVERLSAAADAGLVINPDGLRNQLEGGMLQSLSWTLFEQVRFDRSRVTTSDWNDYAILRFEHVPEVEVTLLDRPDQPAVGAGEAAQGPTAAALANAVFDAVGARVRELPLTPERVLAALA